MITTESDVHISDMKKTTLKTAALTSTLKTFVVRSLKDFSIPLGQKYFMHIIFNLFPTEDFSSGKYRHISSFSSCRKHHQIKVL